MIALKTGRYRQHLPYRLSESTHAGLSGEARRRPDKHFVTLRRGGDTPTTGIVNCGENMDLVAKLLISIAIGLLAILTGCQTPTETDWRLVSEADLTTEERRLRDAAHAARDELARRLKGRLQEELAASGPVGAVQVCSREAAAIASEVSEEFGVRVGRTSHRRRSPSNTPPVWAASLVSQRVDAPNYVRHGGGLYTLLPIRVGPECLLCHGDIGAMPESLVAAIDLEYPNDAGRGFSAGELRGWFWVECSSKSRRTSAPRQNAPSSSAALGAKVH